MSMAIQRSKYTGDPGLFGFIKDVVKTGLKVGGSFLPGPIGAAYRFGSSKLFPPAPGTTTYAQMPPMGRIPARPEGMPGSGQCAPGRAGEISSAMNAARARGDTAEASAFGRELLACGPQTGLGIRNGAGPPMDASGFSPAMQAGKPCPIQGYHWNKSGYFLLSGEYVAPGTKMVKNRRRNPANPRATSNAITRIKGAKRYAASLSSISIRKKC